jgi:hypothetical protein
MDGPTLTAGDMTPLALIAGDIAEVYVLNE